MLSEYLQEQLHNEMVPNVHRGIRKLDEYFQSGSWRTKLDHRTLNLHFYEDCVLGQLFGGYATGLLSMGIQDSEVFGFSADQLADEYTDGKGTSEVYSILTSIWNDAADGYEYDGMPKG